MQFLKFLIVAAISFGTGPLIAAEKSNDAKALVSEAPEPPAEDGNEFKHDLEDAEKKGPALPNDEVSPAAGKPRKTSGRPKDPSKIKKAHKATKKAE